MQHKQGNAEERPDDCCGLNGEMAGPRPVVFHFTGKPQTDKPREHEGRALVSADRRIKDMHHAANLSAKYIIIWL